jgi:Domain of unknown function (DUF5666)
MTRRLLLVILVLTTVAFTTACGGSRSTSSPAAPTGIDSTNTTGDSGTASTGITGTVSSLAGTCPIVSFTLERKSIRTDAATRYDGGACGNVKNAIRVTVSGPTQTDGSIRAEKVTFLAAVPTPTPAPTPTTITGTVSRLGGTCPTLSFQLEGKTIATDAATTYERGACGDVKNAVRVTATGTVQRDSSILAQRIAIPK